MTASSVHGGVLAAAGTLIYRPGQMLCVPPWARPTFHLGHASCICDSHLYKSLFSPSVYELSHAAGYEDGVCSHISSGSGVGGRRRLRDSVGISFCTAPPTRPRNIIW